jgi:hypothetical protein
MGAECKLGLAQATIMSQMSGKLRALVGSAKEAPYRGAWSITGPEAGTVAASLHDKFPGGESCDLNLKALLKYECAIPTMMQILTGEETPLRLVLVEQLDAIGGPTASQALAKLAIYDPAPEVHAAAVKALARRPRDEYREMLLSGLRYPWTPVVSNAAEALASVKDSKVIPALEKLADQADPALPFTKGDTKVVREVVRINHLSNCTLCHAPPDSSEGGVRGVVPVPGEPLPPPTQYYANGDVFVRADVTYLRQDFSLVQPVEDHGEWPKMQRFDFVVRTRAATEDDLRRKPNPAYRETILYALAALKSEKAVTRK